MKENDLNIIFSNGQGTTQTDRSLHALNPEQVELHRLKAEDWLKFAAEYARLINYYDKTDAEIPQGDWQEIFERAPDLSVLPENYNEGKIQPHLALFYAFLKILSFPGQEINALVKDHLDFYYREVLKFKEKPLKPDHVHVLFELAQNAEQVFVDAGVLLDAKKDPEGNPLHYKTEYPVVFNQTKIKEIKSVFYDTNDKALKCASVTNSINGNSEPYESKEVWSAFGDKNWEIAETGFCIASPLLKMTEGERSITLSFSVPTELATISRFDLVNFKPQTNFKPQISAELTGPEDWVLIEDIKAEREIYSVTPFGRSKRPRISKYIHYDYIFTIPEDTSEIDNFNKDVHQLNINTKYPVLKIKFLNKTGLQKFSSSLGIRDMKLSVGVKGYTNLNLLGPLGPLDPKTTFMPFGSTPRKGSKLKVTCPELKNKPVTKMSLDLEWSEWKSPSGFSNYYNAYRRVSVNAANEFPPKIGTKFIGDNSKKIIKLIDKNFTISLGDDKSVIKNPHELELILETSFLHDRYSKAYSKAMIENANGEESDIPNPPFIPQLDHISLSYNAREKINLNDESKGNSHIFYLNPFGTKRATGKFYLENHNFISEYKNGNLYLGLESLVPGQNLSLLFQVEAGSENPSETGNWKSDDIQWHILENNEWTELKDYIVRDSTNHFLRSGIVELTVPKSVTVQNNLLNEELHWLRIQLRKKTGAVCKFIGIHTQAVAAVFEDNENSSEHLKTGLASDIIKDLINPRARIDNVFQPYPSFGGRTAENDSDFYRRVSENLKHKNRAVTIWDVEHLVLEEFPNLFKVKLLPHTLFNKTANSLNTVSPGCFTLVLVPRLSEISEETYRMRPSVNEDLKIQVWEFIKERCSVFIDLYVINPNYEELDLNFNIKFNKGLDSAYYLDVVKTDLIKMMTPWVYDPNMEFKFGCSYTSYDIINYLENRPYVDFVTHFKMREKNGSERTETSKAEPSDPRTVLVLGILNITVITNTCEDGNYDS